MVQVFAPGSKVEIHPGKAPIKGTVLEAAIATGGGVRYRVAWWNGRSRSEDWLEACEVQAAVAGIDPEMVRLGFGG